MPNKNKEKRKNKLRNKHNKYKNEEKFSEDTENVEEDAEDEPQSDGPNYKSLKRKISEDDSDIEDASKKKKKKQPIATNRSDHKGKKSIRQMKREKHAQRQAEAQAAAKDELKSQCISYLSQWKHDRQNWKFMKAKQVWLYKNKFSSHLVPDSSWQTLLEYFESAQGNIRNLLLEDANKVIKTMDEWTEFQNSTDKKDKPEGDGTKNSDANDDAPAPKPEKPDDTSYKRARDIIQSLQE
ncbi:uncharacterized protein C7orf50 homolog [Hyposmocoma kahamanoa]|uniref:uncharacterized protein C7orf50 homolog n=1 Tax=Hyposmocoma kahamanoa TaxID=1477025 RepID=UPI000E6D949B|nr:uncharacterized protein C7orf50 homolog [Hyposmocoma kahamanoa]